MILIVHTADQSRVFIGLAKAGKLISKKQFAGPYRQAEKLLSAIGQLLKADSYQLKVIKGIAVVSGPGPFTALRIGIATANALAWAQKIPVAGVRSNEFRTEAELAKISASKIKKAKVGNFVVPFYGKEPNIHLKK